MHPWLMDKLNQSFPDFDVKTTEEFTYRAMVASVYKKVVAEFINWTEQQVQTAQALQKKDREGEKNPFEIGKGGE